MNLDEFKQLHLDRLKEIEELQRIQKQEAFDNVMKSRAERN